jgi:peptidyl-dipeptidase A
MIRIVSLAALATALVSAPVYAEEAKSPVAMADAFVAKAEKDFNQAVIEAGQAEWVYQTYINQDTEALTARGEAALTTLMVNNALEAAKHAQTPGLSYDTDRKLDRMRTAITLPAPTREGAAQEIATIKARMQGVYGKGKGTLGGQPINGSDIEEKMGTSRNPDELKEMWTTWHDNVGKPMKGDYAQLTALANQGAQGLGFADLGAQWRSNYDMSPDEFAALTEKLWLEVKPLYDSLHTYVRGKLNAKYGDKVQGKTGPIRADLLGNMWAQEWGGIYDLVAPPGSGDVGYDVTELLKDKGYAQDFLGALAVCEAKGP